MQRYLLVTVLTMMECLQGKSASTSTTNNGSFWFCGQNPSCHFFCSEEDGYRFEKAIRTWKSAGAHQPQCHEHQKLARMRIVKDPMREDYGNHFSSVLTVKILVLSGNGAMSPRQLDQTAVMVFRAVYGK
jgi:hypothetical protein